MPNENERTVGGYQADGTEKNKSRVSGSTWDNSRNENQRYARNKGIRRNTGKGVVNMRKVLWGLLGIVILIVAFYALVFVTAWI